jgi:hypothetical protein
MLRIHNMIFLEMHHGVEFIRLRKAHLYASRWGMPQTMSQSPNTLKWCKASWEGAPSMKTFYRLSLPIGTTTTVWRQGSSMSTDPLSPHRSHGASPRPWNHSNTSICSLASARWPICSRFSTSGAQSPRWAWTNPALINNKNTLIVPKGFWRKIIITLLSIEKGANFWRF